MPVVTPTFDELVASFQEQLSDRIPGLVFTDGSAMSLVVSMFSTELRRLYDLLEQAESARDIATASGDDLDGLARPFGILRRSARRAGADSASPQVMVTNTTSAPIALQSNLAFWSPADPSVRLYLTGTATVTAGASVAVQVRALTSGQSVSVGVGQLTANNGPRGLVSTNFLPIQGGTSTEDDESFRYRITQTLRAAVIGGPSSLGGVQSALLSLPGIQDVILLPQARGPATLDALVIPSGGGLPSDDFLTSVQEQMARVCAAGVSVRASAPTVSPVSAEVIVSAGPLTGTVNPAGSLRATVTSLLQGYLDSRTCGLPAGAYSSDSAASDVLYSDLLASVTDACRSILGTSLRSVSLLLSVGSGGATLQGDLAAQPGQIFRSASVSLRLTNS